MYTKDTFHVYYEGNIIKNINPFDFKLLGKGYAKDSFNVYYEGKIIENANPFSFEILNKGYAKDSFNVYYEGKIIENANPFSFELIDHNDTKNLNFKENVKHIEISGKGILKAKLKKHKNIILKINLNDNIGNRNGFFDIGGKNFSDTSQNLYINERKELIGELFDMNNNINRDKLDLNNILEINNGKLEFKNIKKNNKKNMYNDNELISCIIQ